MHKIRKYQTVRNQFGFTLIEMVIYMAIFSIFLLVLTEIFISILNVQLESEATSAVYQDGRYLLSRLSYDVKRAEQIIIPASLGEQTNTMQLLINGVNYSYNVDKGDIQLTTGGNLDKLNSYDTTVSDFTVTRLGNINGKHNLQIGFTLISKAVKAGGAEIKNFQTTIGQR